MSSAGDVNSDGYADLSFLRHLYDAGQTDEGVVFVYYGNQGGLSLRPQQRRSDNSAPIALLGKSDEPDRFRLALLGRTPFGRGKVKLEWEVKPRGVLFDGTGRQRSAAWVDTGTAGRAARRAGRRPAARHALPLAGASPVPPGHHALPADQPLADQSLERLERSAPAHRRAADGGQTGRFGSYTRPVKPPTRLERACADRAVPGRGRGPGETSLAAGLAALTEPARMLAASPTISIPVPLATS